MGLTARKLAEALAQIPPDTPVYVTDQLGSSVVYAPVLTVSERELADMRDRQFAGVVLSCGDGLATRMDGLVLDAEDGHEPDPVTA